MKKTALSIALALTFASAPSFAKKDKEEEEKTIASLIENKTSVDGLFPLYQDKESGEYLMQLNEAQLDTPFLYFAHTVDGVTDAGHFRGNYRET